jgi:DNA-binding phage protein
MLAGLLVALAQPGRLDAAAPLAEKVTGPASCAECHVEEIEAWKRTKHNRTLHELPRRPETAEMLLRLGLTKMKGERQCQDCHFLGQIIDEEYQTVAGIACESCHGASRDWIKTHGEYGKGAKQATETAAHRAARRVEAAAAGMIRADNIYALGAACYGCHIVADEKLANVGGHTPGSAGFNLLTWSQGEVRHTILHTGNKANPEAAPAHRRILFVVGGILETEYCFRAVAQATVKAGFGVTQARRADAARQLLEKIQALAPTPELARIIAVARATGLRLHNAAELAAAADKIAALGREFAAQVTGEQLAGIDALLPGPEAYKGQPYQVPGSP